MFNVIVYFVPSVGGLSLLSFSGWMKMRRCLEISCTALWRETKKMG